MNVFDIIPSEFFNCLSSSANNRAYADFLELIYHQYDKEISYRLERSYLRDVLAAFLLENHLDLSDEENGAASGNDEQILYFENSSMQAGSKKIRMIRLLKNTS